MRVETLEKEILESKGWVISVYELEIEDMQTAENVPYSAHILDTGDVWYVHLRLNDFTSYAHNECLEDAFDEAFDNNEEHIERCLPR